jgi:hypothetical protein
LTRTLTWLRISMSAAMMKNRCVKFYLCCNAFVLVASIKSSLH